MNLDERIAFLVESQESLGKNIERLYETVTQQGEQIRAHDDKIERLETSIVQLGNSVITVNDLVGRLAQAGIHLTDRMDRLAESQLATDQRLNVLIDIVDKLIPRNGRKH